MFLNKLPFLFFLVFGITLHSAHGEFAHLDPILRLGNFGFLPLQLSSGKNSFLAADDFNIISYEINEIRNNKETLVFANIPRAFTELAASRYYILASDDKGQTHIYDRLATFVKISTDNVPLGFYPHGGKRDLPKTGISRLQLNEARLCYLVNEDLKCAGFSYDGSGLDSGSYKVIDFAFSGLWSNDKLCAIIESPDRVRKIKCIGNEGSEEAFSFPKGKVTNPYKISFSSSDNYFLSACILDAEGALCGGGSSAEGVRVPEAKGALNIFVGSGHACALMPSKSALCWDRFSKYGSNSKKPFVPSFFEVPKVNQMTNDGGRICFTSGQSGVKCLFNSSNGEILYLIPKSRLGHMVQAGLVVGEELRSSNWFLELAQISSDHRKSVFKSIGFTLNDLLLNEPSPDLRLQLHYLSLHLTYPILSATNSRYFVDELRSKFENYVSQVMNRLAMPHPDRDSIQNDYTRPNLNFALNLLKGLLHTSQDFLRADTKNTTIEDMKKLIDLSLAANGPEQDRLIREIAKSQIFWSSLRVDLTRSPKSQPYAVSLLRTVNWLKEF